MAHPGHILDRCTNSYRRSSSVLLFVLKIVAESFVVCLEAIRKRSLLDVLKWISASPYGLVQFTFFFGAWWRFRCPAKLCKWFKSRVNFSDSLRSAAKIPQVKKWDQNFYLEPAYVFTVNTAIRIDYEYIILHAYKVSHQQVVVVPNSPTFIILAAPCNQHGLAHGQIGHCVYICNIRLIPFPHPMTYANLQNPSYYPKYCCDEAQPKAS